jgi:hypothetical protein
VWSCTSTLPMCLRGVVLIYAQGQLYLYLAVGSGVKYRFIGCLVILESVSTAEVIYY